MPAGYDIIGDVHGQADALARLCRRLGYDDWGHHAEGRRAVFVGDLNDKGPDSGLVVDRVEAWVGAGRALAIMGNHELNAVAWNVPRTNRENGNGKWLRPHNSANRRQHEAHLAEARRNPWRYVRDLAFFRTLPLWLDLGEVRLIHACWHEDALRVFRRELRDGRFITDATLEAAYTPTEPLHRAVENALKGPGVNLPESAHYEDAQGKTRTRARMRWWAPEGASLAELCLLKSKPPKFMRKRQPRWRVSYTDDVPVFFGHYHLTGKPRATADNAVCVDWGAGSGRRLAAYRFSGNAIRDEDFTSVKVR